MIIEESKQEKVEAEFAKNTAPELAYHSGDTQGSYEFHKGLDKMMKNMVTREQRRDKNEKKMLADLLKSKIFRPASKPWEAVNIQ